MRDEFRKALAGLHNQSAKVIHKMRQQNGDRSEARRSAVLPGSPDGPAPPALQSALQTVVHRVSIADSGGQGAAAAAAATAADRPPNGTGVVQPNGSMNKVRRKSRRNQAGAHATFGGDSVLGSAGPAPASISGTPAEAVPSHLVDPNDPLAA